MRKFVVGALAAAVLAGACAATPVVAAAPHAAAPAKSQRLLVKIDGLAAGRVKVDGRGASRVVRRSGTVRLPAGRYRVRALPVQRSDVRYLPSPSTVRVRVLKGRPTVLRVTYSPANSAGTDATLTSPAPDGVLGDVLTLLNQARATGVRCDTTWMPAAPAVTYNDDLALAAQLHAQDMADKDYFSHDSLDGRSFIDRIAATPYAGDPGGENIASGFQSASAVMDGWLKSPGHCRNLMNPDFDHVGLGLAIRNDARYSIPVTYWVQDFGYEPLR